MDTLGKGYSAEELIAVLAGKRQHQSRKNRQPVGEKSIEPSLLYAGFLTCGSISDIRTHTVPDWVWMGVAGTALIGMKLSSLPSMLLGAAAVLLIEVPLAVAMKDRAVGGADIKISAAGAFLLGWRRGLAALIVGLLLAVLIMPVIRAIRHEKQDTRFALVPFLAAGQIALYLI